MTETSPLATVSYPRAELRDAGEDERFRRAAMAGAPVPLVDVRIRGDDGRDAPLDGKTHGRGAGARALHHRQLPPGAGQRRTSSRADGWLRTGDVATMDELAYLRITDRTKDLIKSGGEWISFGRPGERADGAPGRRRGGGDRHPRREVERAAAGLRRAQARADAPTRAALGAHLLQHGFAKWQLPDRYEVIDAVPRTSTGKFWKLKLREHVPALTPT